MAILPCCLSETTEPRQWHADAGGGGGERQHPSATAPLRRATSSGRSPALSSSLSTFLPVNYLHPRGGGFWQLHPPFKKLIDQANQRNSQGTFYPLWRYSPIVGQLLCAYEGIMSNSNQSLSDGERDALSNFDLVPVV
jgi:hypothetical protein